MIVRRGFGSADDGTPDLVASLDNVTAMLPEFFQQQYGPAPLWVWTAGALVLWWWLFMPSGSEYREKRRKLRSEYSGVSKLKRRRSRVKSGLKQVIS